MAYTPRPRLTALEGDGDTVAHVARADRRQRHGLRTSQRPPLRPPGAARPDRTAASRPAAEAADRLVAFAAGRSRGWLAVVEDRLLLPFQWYPAEPCQCFPAVAFDAQTVGRRPSKSTKLEGRPLPVRAWSPLNRPYSGRSTGLIRAAGLRWPVEEDFEFGKDCFGLDECQARLYSAILRHIVLVMAALAICATTAAQLKDRTDTQAPAAPSQKSDAYSQTRMFGSR
jgi:hypothetical protein